MDRISVAARRAAVMAVAFGTVIACGVLTWHAVNPGVIGRLGTAHLLGLLGLYLAPFGAFLAWRWERIHRAEAPLPEKSCEIEAPTRENRHAHAAHHSDAGVRQHHRRRAGVTQS